MKLFATYIILVFTSSLVHAQYLYATKDGKVSIISTIDQNRFVLHSKELKVFLDYEHAAFTMRLHLNTLHSGIDSIDVKLKKMVNNDVLLQGHLEIESINTQAHDPQHFTFSSNLSYMEKTIEIIGNGHLEHIYGGDYYACVLGLNFELDPSFFAITLPESSTLKVQIIETVLKLQDDGE